MSDDRFDWSDDETVAVRTQMGIAIYTNPHGDIVIRQEGQFHPDDDTWIVFDPRNAMVVARRILEVAGVEPVDAFPEIHTAALHSIGNSCFPDRKSGNAERQRRYRERRREAESQQENTTPLLAAE